MRAWIVTAALTAAVTTTLSAQLRRDRPAVPVRGISLDVAAALDHRYRVTVEPAVFGRVSLGITGSFTRTPEVDLNYYPYPLATADLVPCYPDQYCPPVWDGNSRYRAWTFDFSARWYPAFLSVQGPQARVMAYVGEYLGYSRRELGAPQYYAVPQPYPCAYCEAPPRADSAPGYLVPNGRQEWPQWVTQAEGLEPGLEVGIRAVALPFLFVDVGWSMRLVRLDDPMRRKRPGDVDGRLVVAAGVGW